MLACHIEHRGNRLHHSFSTIAPFKPHNSPFSHVINAGQLKGECWISYYWIVITKKFRTQDNLHFRTNAKFSSGNYLFKFLAIHIVCCIQLMCMQFSDGGIVGRLLTAIFSHWRHLERNFIPKCTEACLGLPWLSGCFWRPFYWFHCTHHTARRQVSAQ